MCIVVAINVLLILLKSVALIILFVLTIFHNYHILAKSEKAIIPINFVEQKILHLHLYFLFRLLMKWLLKVIFRECLPNRKIVP